MKVSVLCLVYNHEKYLRKFFDGLVNQKVDFDYEILVHDDASTDNSAKIIMEYQRKYPNLIKTIIQKENQYKKGINPNEIFNFPSSTGEYIAYCEGDDYWCDENKLKRQVQIFDENNNCSIVVHDVLCIEENGKSAGKTRPCFHISEGFVESNEVVELCLNSLESGNGLIFQTSSYMVRRSWLKRYYEESPSFKSNMFGDLPLLLYMINQGYLYYIKKTMSCYRLNSISSVQNTVMYKDINSVNMANNEQYRCLSEFNINTGYKFNKYIDKYLLESLVKKLSLQGKYLDIYSDAKMRKYIKSNRSLKWKIHALLNILLGMLSRR